MTNQKIQTFIAYTIREVENAPTSREVIIGLGAGILCLLQLIAERLPEVKDENK